VNKQLLEEMGMFIRQSQKNELIKNNNHRLRGSAALL